MLKSKATTKDPFFQTPIHCLDEFHSRLDMRTHSEKFGDIHPFQGEEEIIKTNLGGEERNVSIQFKIFSPLPSSVGILGT